MNQQLFDYIQKAKAAGQSDSQTKSALEKAGWQETDIDEALKTLGVASSVSSQGVSSSGVQPRPVVRVDYGEMHNDPGRSSVREVSGEVKEVNIAVVSGSKKSGKFFWIFLSLFIILIIALVALVRFKIIPMPKNKPLQNAYIKIVCAGKHFSCPQNLSDECRVDGKCVN